MSEPGPDQAALRSPDEVMRLARLGASHPTRLSFMRALLRDLKRENWRFDRPVWRFDERGVGRAVYCAHGPRRTYSLVAFGHDLPDDLRTDRVIATAWDATFCLFDGIPGEDDLDRLANNVPRQEAGRVTERELSLSRANRSVRLWGHVIDSLAAGRQPDDGMIGTVGYLMRTTAVYGSGKFGAADRSLVAGREVMGHPFRLELLSVWLIRSFSLDLAEHIARCQGGTNAVTMAPHVRRKFGIGNSTGLGMAPFLIRHPTLIHAWVRARETALARVCACQTASAQARDHFASFTERALLHTAQWQTVDEPQAERVSRLVDDLERVRDQIQSGALELDRPWQRLVAWSREALSLEGQELLVSLVVEPHGALVDDLASQMGADEDASFLIDGSQTVDDLKAMIDAHYGWALAIDYSQPDHCQAFWYTSEEKLEPRLGNRHTEPGAELELPLGIGRDVAELCAALNGWPGHAYVRDYLIDNPHHRHVLRRVQIGSRHPYAEIRDNLLGCDLRPIDLLRAKLAFFGATRFDPRSDRWLRICLYQNAPFPDELHGVDADDWMYPPLKVDGLETEIQSARVAALAP